MTRQIDQETARAAFARAIAGDREVFGDFFIARLLGLEIGYDDSGCNVAFDAADFLFNPQGTLHGGIIATALDIAMGHHLRHRVGVGTTLEFKVQFLGAVRGGRVICRGEMLRQGRSICFLRAEARDASGEAVASATSTWKLLKQG
ncbi:PaaI family thioesterase [Roseomonas sp. NAR14]|uniref:PaaI family thioesterase n=1 Tax=Roseomonas acroporae TaxID=2937791 RepID=A0A9X1Y940_9PROT|nr:PaaI family thioesterase [Roseomonas acroporae]MCK8785793.1 PaaI family thioesterase [Roseomonas acroporae]